MPDLRRHERMLMSPQISAKNIPVTNSPANQFLPGELGVRDRTCLPTTIGFRRTPLFYRDTSSSLVNWGCL